VRTRIQWTDGILDTSGGLSYRSRFGTSPTPSGLFQLSDGTGTGAANTAYEAALSIAAGATSLIDLKGGNGEKDVLGVALAMTAVKGVELILTTAPATGVSLRFGPQAATNAAQLWFQAVTANFWTEVKDRFAMFDRHAGWTIGASTKVLAVHNPGAATVAAWIRVLGIK
jgi:hypothetical protein